MAAMGVSKQKSHDLAMAQCAGCAVLLVLCLMAPVPVRALCSIGQLSQCSGAVMRGSDPTPQCCSQVGAIADFNCFCNMMLSQRTSVPPAYINNAVLVPSRCGPQGDRLRDRQCGDIHIP